MSLPFLKPDVLLVILINVYSYVVPILKQIVPGQGYALLEVSFTPPSSVKAEEHYLGYALGYMSLMDKV